MCLQSTLTCHSLLQELHVEHQSEAVILPGGDPDAGMPADQAEIHGTERHSTSDAHPSSQQDTNEQGPPPAVDTNQQSVDPNELDRPPHTSSNEQGHPPVRTSPANPAITDSIDEDTSADNTINNNKNVSITSVPDSA